MKLRLSIRDGVSLVQRDADTLELCMADIALFGDHICRIGALAGNDTTQSESTFDASGLLVLPGIVDIHGDALERQIQPRPETVFPHEIALADTDRQLVANGITTACHGLTYSWEGGLRGREAAIALMEQIALQRKSSHADHLVHLRFENHHVEGLPDVLAWIAQGKIAFLAFNEHFPGIARKSQRPEKLAAYAERARCTPDMFMQRLQFAGSQSARVDEAIGSIAAACRAHRIPMASHDDETCEGRNYYQALGATVSEFPRTQDALCRAIALDNRVVMGSPNVLLGGSHCGGLAAIDAVRDGRCDILASDYYYPALLHAPFKLARQGACSLVDAWRLVAENPARALGLDDRGRIADGYRADLVLVEASPAGDARLIATIAAGKLVYCAEPERLLNRHLQRMAA